MTAMLLALHIAALSAGLAAAVPSKMMEVRALGACGAPKFACVHTESVAGGHCMQVERCTLMACRASQRHQPALMANDAQTPCVWPMIHSLHLRLASCFVRDSLGQSLHHVGCLVAHESRHCVAFLFITRMLVDAL
jgi:hypothetical protein